MCNWKSCVLNHHVIFGFDYSLLNTHLVQQHSFWNVRKLLYRQIICLYPFLKNCKIDSVQTNSKLWNCNISHQIHKLIKWQVQIRLTGGNFKEGSWEPSPHIWDSLREVIGKSLLLKGGYAVGDYMPDLGQVPKVTSHVESWSEKRRKTPQNKTGIKKAQEKMMGDWVLSSFVGKTFLKVAAYFPHTVITPGIVYWQ